MRGVRNFDQLLELYRNAEDSQIALFLGSGVNGGSWAKEHPACASWPKLLRALDDHFHTENRLKTGLEACNADWIRVAAKLLDDKDREVVIRAIDEAVYSGVFRDPTIRIRTPRKHKVLTWTVLRRMDTLQATVCFSAAISNPTKARSMRRNPKLGRVLTTNYDFFFSAAWPRYTSMRQSWWPVTWASTGTRPDSAGPIVYLHGYLPYSGERERDVIITKSDYDRAYSGTVECKRGFAWRELTDAVDHCHLIFIGFSFSDIRVAEALRQGGSSMKHFAFLLGSESQTIEAAKKANVTPVILENWVQLPTALERLYCTGLTQQELDRTRMTKSQYWAKLQSGLEPRKRALPKAE